MPLTKKSLRTISFALKNLYHLKSFHHIESFEDLRAISNLLLKELRHNGKTQAILTEEGLSYINEITSVLSDSDLFSDEATYADIYNACRKILTELLEKQQQPDDGAELVDLLKREVASKIDIHHFAVPLFGVELVGLPTLKLGTMAMVASSSEYLDEAGVDHAHSDVTKTIEKLQTKFWLTGSAVGTPRAAENKFIAQSELVAGLLAIAAGALYQQGASAFRIGAVISASRGSERSAWLSWTDREKSLITHFKGQSSQSFEIDGNLLMQLNESGVFDKAIAIFQAGKRSPLEDAITRAVYWYSDAHREPLPVMKLVKYWSCIEAFFSSNCSDITRSVSTGLAAVLVFGRFRFIPIESWKNTKDRAVKLYNLRSRAVHRASHTHVSERDAADISQWVAWMVLSMIAFTVDGYTTLDEVVTQTDRLDASMQRGAIAKAKRA